MSVPYSGSENITVLPQNLSTGTGGNTAQYESTDLQNNASMKGGFISQHQPKSKRNKSKRNKSKRGKYGHSQRNKSKRNKHGRHHRR